MSVERFDTGAVELEVEVLGPEDGVGLLLVSGAGAPAGFWHPAFLERFTPRYRVVRYCNRDTGTSTHLDAPYPLTALLDDVRALLEGLFSGPAHVVGHSMGGYLAQLALCRFPERVRSAVAIAAGPAVDPGRMQELGISSPDPALWAALLQNQPQGDVERDLPGWLRSWRVLHGTRPLDEALARDYTRGLYVGDPRNAQVAVHHVQAMQTLPLTLPEELGRAQGPLLAVHGSHDPLVPADNGRASARLAARGRYQELEGMGHMIFDLATWSELADAVEAHLEPGS